MLRSLSEGTSIIKTKNHSLWSPSNEHACRDYSSLFDTNGAGLSTFASLLFGSDFLSKLHQHRASPKLNWSWMAIHALACSLISLFFFSLPSCCIQTFIYFLRLMREKKRKRKKQLLKPCMYPENWPPSWWPLINANVQFISDDGIEKHRIIIIYERSNWLIEFSHHISKKLMQLNSMFIRYMMVPRFSPKYHKFIHV